MAFSAVRPGLSLPEALTQLRERGPGPLRPAFSHFGHDHLAVGRFTDCLDRLKDDFADPVGDPCRPGAADEVCGGELGTMLRALSRLLRDDVRTRSELESRQAWVVNDVYVFSPWKRCMEGVERVYG